MKFFEYPRLHLADIPEADRKPFEQVGETGIQLTLAGGFNPRSQELSDLYTDKERVKYAQQWLTERGDIHTRHEWRTERVEWAILIFVAIGVFADLYLAIHGVGSK